MAKWIPHRLSGDQTPIEARKFKHWIGVYEHWFALHSSLNNVTGYDVSDWDSGLLVTNVPHMFLITCKGDAKDAARLARNKLVERYGESKVHDKLKNAPKREKVLSKAVASATL